MTAIATAEGTVGLFGRPAAGILEDSPEVVLVERGKGYPFPPFAEVPDDHFDGASSVGKCVGMDWSNIAKYRALKFAANKRRELAEFTRQEDAYAAIKEWFRPEDTAAMDFGSAVHLHTARRDAGRDTDGIPCDDAKRLDGCVAAWERFKTDYAIRFGAIERTLYAEGLKVAGTADRIALAGNPPPGWTSDRMFVIDIKTTGQSLSRVAPSIEYLIQLTALAAATHIVYEEARDFIELPVPITGGALVYLTPEGYRAHFIDTDQPAVLDLVHHCVSALRAKRQLGRGAYGLGAVQRLADTGPFATVK
jgi:hypothetical protein